MAKDTVAKTTKDKKPNGSAEYNAHENAPLDSDGVAEPSQLVKDRIARHKKMAKAPDTENDPFGPDQFTQQEDSAVVKARRERLAKTVGDASTETTGKSYGVSDAE